MGRTTTYALIMSVVLCIISHSQTWAQQISAQQTTPAGNSVKAGNLSYTYSIGNLGYAMVPYSAKTTPKRENAIRPQDMEVACYPNPFRDELHIRINSQSEIPSPRVMLYDMAGHAITAGSRIEYSNGKAVITIPATHLEQGKYTIRITTGSRTLAVGAIKI